MLEMATAVPRRRRTAAVAAAVAVALLVGALPAGAARAAPGATGWSWPLDAGPGPPVVLRRASIPAHRWEPGHRGVDLAAAPGQAVLAPVDGVVVTASQVAGRGVVSISSASGWRATLEAVDAGVRVGDRVHRGQQVGVVSAGGGHCGALSCLHWGVRAGSGPRTAYRDPLVLLRRRAVLMPVPGWSRSPASTRLTRDTATPPGRPVPTDGDDLTTEPPGG